MCCPLTKSVYRKLLVSVIKLHQNLSNHFKPIDYYSKCIRLMVLLCYGGAFLIMSDDQ